MTRTLPSTPVALLVGFMMAGCGGQSKGDRADEKLVPEETQQEAREQQGRQQMMMDDLNMTPAERAAARHEDATRPVEREKKAPKKK